MNWIIFFTNIIYTYLLIEFKLITVIKLNYSKQLSRISPQEKQIHFLHGELATASLHYDRGTWASQPKLSHVTCFSETHLGVWANRNGKARLVYWHRRWSLKSWRQASIKHFLQNQPPPNTFIKHFCKIDSSRCQIHPPHTHKKEKKKKQQENGFEPTIFEKSEQEMAFITVPSFRHRTSQIRQ